MKSHAWIRPTVGIGLALLAFGILFRFIDWRLIPRVVEDVDAAWAALAVGIAMASMICMSAAFALFAHVFGVRMRLRDLTEIGFVSLAFGRLVAFTGAPGYAMRLLMTTRYGAPFDRVLAASLMHSMANDLVLFALVPLGLAYILQVKALTGVEAAGLLAACLVFLLIIVVWMALILNQTARAWTLRWIGRIWHRITKKDAGAVLHKINLALEVGKAALRQRPRLLVAPLALLLADWILAVAALGLCFVALGEPIGFGVLVTGFAIGTWVGFISNLPGGLGVLEGSMVGVYAYLGVPLETAALAALAYRLVYYVVPYLVSLAFYWRHLRPMVKEAQEAEAALAADDIAVHVSRPQPPVTPKP